MKEVLYAERIGTVLQKIFSSGVVKGLAGLEMAAGSSLDQAVRFFAVFGSEPRRKRRNDPKRGFPRCRNAVLCVAFGGLP